MSVQLESLPNLVIINQGLRMRNFLYFSYAEAINGGEKCRKALTTMAKNRNWGLGRGLDAIFS